MQAYDDRKLLQESRIRSTRRQRRWDDNTKTHRGEIDYETVWWMKCIGVVADGRRGISGVEPLGSTSRV
jgi:hypothetical protein